MAVEVCGERTLSMHLLTDSLGGPRTNESEDVYYEHTWISKIINEFSRDYTISTLVRHSLNSSEITRNLNTYVNGFAPDVLFVQVGIVDSFPRVILQKERFLIMRLPFNLGEFIIKKVIRKIYPYFTKFIKRNEVSLDKFEKNMVLLRSRCAKIHFIPILPACDAYSRISPTANNSISQYNKVLANLTANPRLFEDFLNDENFKSGKYVINDYHHLNLSGHDKVYRYVREVMLSEASM